MRLLVFCGTRRAIERFDMAGWLIIVPQYPPEQCQQIINEFRATPEARLAVQGKAMVFGWRAPDDTEVLFDPTWPYPLDSAESIQAAARVGRLAKQPVKGLTTPVRGGPSAT